MGGGISNCSRTSNRSNIWSSKSTVGTLLRTNEANAAPAHTGKVQVQIGGRFAPHGPGPGAGPSPGQGPRADPTRGQARARARAQAGRNEYCGQTCARNKKTANDTCFLSRAGDMASNENRKEEGRWGKALGWGRDAGGGLATAWGSSLYPEPKVATEGAVKRGSQSGRRRS